MALAVILLPFALGLAIYALVARDTEPVGVMETRTTGEDYYANTDYESYAEGYEALAETGDTGASPNIGIPLRSIYVRDYIDTGYMALVNRRHAVRSKPGSDILAAAWPTVAVSRIDGMYLHVSALRAVSEMFASAREADIAAFFVSSGFRSYADQASIYGDGSNSDFVQPPGHSEHHTGLAADILAPGIGMAEMADTPEGSWLAANSYRYGLILRYPEGATLITGIAFEPWHFRYVGRAHAYYMKRSGLVLEEYIQRIHYLGHFYFAKNGITYHILHQVPQNGMIYVPEGLDFILSGDNKGGYIIKAW